MSLTDRIDNESRTLKIDSNITPSLHEEVDTCLGKEFILSQNLMLRLANHSACEDVFHDAKSGLCAEEQHPM